MKTSANARARGAVPVGRQGGSDAKREQKEGDTTQVATQTESEAMSPNEAKEKGQEVRGQATDCASVGTF